MEEKGGVCERQAQQVRVRVQQLQGRVQQLQGRWLPPPPSLGTVTRRMTHTHPMRIKEPLSLERAKTWRARQQAGGQAQGNTLDGRASQLGAELRRLSSVSLEELDQGLAEDRGNRLQGVTAHLAATVVSLQDTLRFVDQQRQHVARQVLDVDRQVGEQEELQQLLRNQLEERQRLEEGRGVVVQHHVRDKEQQDKVLHLRGLLDGLLFSPDLEPYLGEAASSALQTLMESDRWVPVSELQCPPIVLQWLQEAGCVLLSEDAQSVQLVDFIGDR